MLRPYLVSLWYYAHISQANAIDILQFERWRWHFLFENACILIKHYYFTHFYSTAYILASQLLYHPIIKNMRRNIMWYCTMCVPCETSIIIGTHFQMEMLVPSSSLENACIFNWYGNHIHLFFSNCFYNSGRLICTTSPDSTSQD